MLRAFVMPVPMRMYQIRAFQQPPIAQDLARLSFAEDFIGELIADFVPADNFDQFVSELDVLAVDGLDDVAFDYPGLSRRLVFADVW